jgi:FeS assembly SUF system regulator
LLRITKQTDYGIVLMSLFAAAEAGETLSARGLAEQSGLPLPMVGKILKLLVRDGLLESQRGAHGGYRLSREATAITVAQIVEALEGPIAITECADDRVGCRQTRGCPLQANWQRINRAIQQALSGISLREMSPAYGACNEATMIELASGEGR